MKNKEGENTTKDGQILYGKFQGYTDAGCADIKVWKDRRHTYTLGWKDTQG